MLTLNNVTLTQGAKVLIESIHLTVFEKNRFGIVGSNGCGKTSLLSVITGKQVVHSGDLLLKKDLTFSYLEQEVPAHDYSAVNYVMSGDQVLFQVVTALETAEKENDYETMMHCHTQLHELEGYRAEGRASKLLVGLGFKQDELKKPINAFSGGWRMRLNLAKCLFTPSELLILDEPTNHLDLETVLWLENFIHYYPGAILMVSHDRDFLDKTVTHIAHIKNKQLTLYTGNYSSFEKRYAEKLIIQQLQYKKQQADITHKMDFVNRFGAKATKAKQAQSRLRAIEKMALVKPVYDEIPFKFRFLLPDKTSNPMLTMDKVDLGYGDKIILTRVNFSIMNGQRIGLLGVNGAGKSTLIKSICGELTPLKGAIEKPSKLVVGYFAQHQVDHLPLFDSPLTLLKRDYPNKTEKEIIAYLGSFAFDRDQALLPLQHFSGGEKARVALARMIWNKPNLLLLDEPTNHFDLEMRQALSIALQSYEGAMILVSHDRYLMRTLVDELFLIEHGKLHRIEESFDSYTAAHH